MKKILALLLVVILTATVSISGTLAFMQIASAEPDDTETDGPVKIDQQIYYRDYTEGNRTQNCTLRPSNSGFVLFPAVYNELEAKGNYDGYGMYEYPNVQDEIVVVYNAENSTDAYVRTWIAIECGDMSKDEFEATIRLNKNETDWSWETKGLYEIEGKKHYVLLATFKAKLATNATTAPSLLQIMLSKDAGNVECATLDSDGDGTLKIRVFSQAAEPISGKSAQETLDAEFKTNPPWTPAEPTT